MPLFCFRPPSLLFFLIDLKKGEGTADSKGGGEDQQGRREEGATFTNTINNTCTT